MVSRFCQVLISLTRIAVKFETDETPKLVETLTNLAKTRFLSFYSIDRHLLINENATTGFLSNKVIGLRCQKEAIDCAFGAHVVGRFCADGLPSRLSNIPTARTRRLPPPARRRPPRPFPRPGIPRRTRPPRRPPCGRCNCRA